jgi:predicted transposase/invertase (TIGR01784 family)
MANRKKTFEEVFTEAGIIPEWIERGIEQGEEKKALAIARNLLAKGWVAEEVAETTDLPVEKVHSLAVD